MTGAQLAGAAAFYVLTYGGSGLLTALAGGRAGRTR